MPGAYNAGLQERREAYRLAHKALLCYAQINELPLLKAVCSAYKDVPSHVLQDVLWRLDKAFAGVFRRLRNGEIPSFPRFVGRGRYSSFTYPDHAGWKLADGRLVLPGIGDLTPYASSLTAPAIPVSVTKRAPSGMIGVSTNRLPKGAS